MKKYFLILFTLLPIIGWGQCESIDIYTGQLTKGNEINNHRNGYFVPNISGNGTAPYQYSYSNGDTTQAGTFDQPAGTYQLTITDANGCTTDTSFTIGNDIISYSGGRLSTNPQAYTGVTYTDTVYIENTGDYPATLTDYTIYAFKGGVTFNTRISFNGVVEGLENFAITSYDTTGVGLPLLYDPTIYNSNQIYVSTEGTAYIGDLNIQAWDTSYNLGQSGPDCIAAVAGDASLHYSAIYINNVHTYGGLRGISFAGSGSQCRPTPEQQEYIQHSELYVSNSTVRHTRFDGMYCGYAKFLRMNNIRVDSVNLNWYIDSTSSYYIGGDCYQSEAIDSVVAYSSTYDRSAAGGKFSFIANGALRGVLIDNCIIKGHRKNSTAASAIYGGSGGNCGVSGFWEIRNSYIHSSNRGFWPHSGYKIFNTVFDDFVSSDPSDERASILLASDKLQYFDSVTFNNSGRALGTISTASAVDRVAYTPFIHRSLFVNNDFSVYPSIWQPSTVYPDSADKVTGNAFYNSPFVGSDTVVNENPNFTGDYFTVTNPNLIGHGAVLDSVNLGYSQNIIIEDEEITETRKFQKKVYCPAGKLKVINRKLIGR